MDKKTILVVDDERSTLELIDFVLRQHDYETILVSKPEEAFQLSKDQPPDLIILDLLMPGINGTDLCKQFKSNPMTQKIPILFLSAVVRDTEVEKGFRAGASGYIFKPFDSKQIVKRVGELLSS